MTIRDWPEMERPRERLLRLGPEVLSDAELLAIFLRTGVQGMSAVALARELLRQFGGIRALLETDLQGFSRMRGLGGAKYAQLQAVLELGRRHLFERLAERPLLQSPADTRAYLNARLRHYPHEVFAVLLLDSRHRVLAFEELFRGTIDGASVHPRELVKLALAHNAAALICAHNHPSGVAEPSQADRQITHRLQQALGLVEVRLLDHFIIGEGEPLSFAEQGWL